MLLLFLGRVMIMLDSNTIQDILPHRYPFLLVDRVQEMNDASIRAIKSISISDMVFVGHFPQKHVYPGVLIIEALAQTGAILLLSKEAFKGKIAYLVGVDNFRFRKQVLPGDTLSLEVTLTKMKGVIGIAEGVAKVGDAVCAKGTIKFAIND